MLASQRQTRILEAVRVAGGARVSELTDLLGVSDMTIRRDLEVLAASGLVDKVHGGATARGRLSADEPGFEAKSDRQLDEKESIARTAAQLVEPGQAIGIGAGTTTWRVAHDLIAVPDLTVVTNSIEVANVFHREPRPDLTVVLTGGVRTPSDALVGPVAVSTVQSLHLDLVFLGVHGMAEDAGFTTPNLLEAETNQAFIAAASRFVVVADHTKWGIRGFCRIAPLRDANVLVTDDALPRDAQSVIGDAVERLLLVTAGTGGQRKKAGGAR